MRAEHETDLATIARALGYRIISSTVSEFGKEFGWLELLDVDTGQKFRWNPVVHAGDRYKLIKAANMMVNFAGGDDFAQVIVPIPGTADCKMLEFAKDADEQVEAMAIISLASAWATAKVALQPRVA